MQTFRALEQVDWAGVMKAADREALDRVMDGADLHEVVVRNDERRRCAEVARAARGERIAKLIEAGE